MQTPMVTAPCFLNGQFLRTITPIASFPMTASSRDAAPLALSTPSMPVAAAVGARMLPLLLRRRRRLCLSSFRRQDFLSESNSKTLWNRPPILIHKRCEQCD